MTPTDAATLQALIEGADATAREHEQTWGLDRLPTLVDDPLRARFYRQKAKWSTVMEDAYNLQRSLTPAELEAAVEMTAALKRGWQAMATQAAKNGAEPITADVWEMRLSDGSRAALVRTTAEAAHVIDTGRDDGRYVAVWTLDEIVSVIAANLSVSVSKAQAVKALSPKVDRSWLREGDAVPFGDEPALTRVLADFE